MSPVFNIIYIMIAVAMIAWASASLVKGTDREMSWTVPEGVSKIKVISSKDGDPLFSTTINVQPGQKFTVKAID